MLHLKHAANPAGAPPSASPSSWRCLRAPEAVIWDVEYQTNQAPCTCLLYTSELLGNPFHYRDERTNGMMEETFKVVPREEVFGRTGIQFMQLNSLYQLVAMVKNGSTALKCASTLLFMPDLFNYWLTGRKVSEFSIASTSQFYDCLLYTSRGNGLYRLWCFGISMPKPCTLADKSVRPTIPQSQILNLKSKYPQPFPALHSPLPTLHYSDVYKRQVEGRGRIIILLSLFAGG